MSSPPENLIVDSSVAIKWEMTTEPQAAEALELLRDWQHSVIEVCVPNFLLLEVANATLQAFRRGRITEAQADQAVDVLLFLPFKLLALDGPLLRRAYDIAKRHTQKAYDCAYVALAERHAMDLWTGDLRLFNALHFHFPRIRWIGDYRRKRP
jgi:predicted nucleic acid-binding protein